MASVDEKTLLRLQAEGWASELIGLRLAHAEADSALKYLGPILGQNRVHPHFLPTQKSGRWSTSNPPLPNWSAKCISPGCSKRETWHVAKSTVDCWSLRDIVVPDDGYYFLKRDWDAIEAKLAAAYSGDERDLELFARGDDIHTATMCEMFGFPEPPDLRDPHKSDDCVAWRLAVSWGGKDDWRRVASKTCRYSLAYGTDERAIHQARDAEELSKQAGVDKKGLEAIAKKYLDSKPKLKAFKRTIWKQVIETHETRTALGRRRRLFVTPEETARWHKSHLPGPACREGLNHMFQGWVADAQNLTLIEIKKRWPMARLAYQTHDGDIWVFPEAVSPWPAIRDVVEREWSIAGRQVKSTASWSMVYADGRKEELG